ncbi:hypothetical protein [Clostridium sp. C8-1-8]|uniref:hypothetical protein n=1 Tax=Clostridium sp. C8-1-8 TaxID=2698831 RepID=UPI00136AC2EE|nr:hypothetical protein [Clostridium sp. C8-1-8]
MISCFILTGCTKSSPKYNHGNSTFTKDGSSEISKGNNSFDFEVDKSFKTVKLKLDIKTDEGNLEWEAKDPTGKIVWNGNLKEKSSFAETKDFAPVEGKWSLTIKTEKASGYYDIVWSNK